MVNRSPGAFVPTLGKASFPRDSLALPVRAAVLICLDRNRRPPTGDRHGPAVRSRHCRRDRQGDLSPALLRRGYQRKAGSDPAGLGMGRFAWAEFPTPAGLLDLFARDGGAIFGLSGIRGCKHLQNFLFGLLDLFVAFVLFFGHRRVPSCRGDRCRQSGLRPGQRGKRGQSL